MTKLKVAIVTGGGSGLGFAIARKLTENNIHTILVGRDKTKLDTAVNTLGANAEAISFDLTDLSKVSELVQQIVQQHGAIDILVNNAGINQK